MKVFRFVIGVVIGLVFVQAISWLNATYLWAYFYK